MNTPNIEILAEEIRNLSNARVTVERTCVEVHLPHGYWALGNVNENWTADFYPFATHEIDSCIHASMDLGYASDQTADRDCRAVAARLCFVLGIAQ